MPHERVLLVPPPGAHPVLMLPLEMWYPASLMMSAVPCVLKPNEAFFSFREGFTTLQLSGRGNSEIIGAEAVRGDETQTRTKLFGHLVSVSVMDQSFPF